MDQHAWLLPRLSGVVVVLLLVLSFPLMGDALAVVPSVTPSLTLTPTPIPPQDLDLLPVLESLMTAEYEDCELPCWWGFRAGESTLEEVVAFVEETGFDRQWARSMYSDTLSLEEYIGFSELILLNFEPSYAITGNFQLSFAFDQEDAISLISLRFWHPNEWLSAEANRVGLSQVFSQIEEMPVIYVSQNYRRSFYPMRLEYRERQVQISYRFDLSDHIYIPRSGLQELCLDLERTLRISMYLDISPDNMAESLPESWVTLEQAYGIDSQEFVQFFRDNPDGCFDLRRPMPGSP